MIRLLLALSIATPAWAEAPLPPTPKYHFVDEVGVVSGETSNAVSSILLEHERTTSEQVVIAIFKSLQDEDVADRTLKISQAWRIGKKGKDNGMLLALYWEDKKSRIEVGYGLEGQMTDAKSNQILSEVLAPELRAGDPNRAIVLTALEVLTQLESPIIKNGRAEELLRTGGIQRGWQPRDTREVSRGWFVWIILGFILLSVAFNFMTAADAHFTGGGWYRPNPWRRARRGIFWGGVAGGLGGLGGGRGGWGGGGGFGGGGGGGFLGGGGSFGGGGASGSW